MYASITPASSVADVFEEYLRELAITEFPCGDGKWRNNIKWESDLLESNIDVNAEQFTVERLLELSRRKPFCKEIVWSTDGKNILDKAIQYPLKTTLENVHKKFKCLRMVNKNIDNVDDNIKKFVNLEELVLSANNIRSLKSKLLPRSLRVLELSGNELNENIGSLCTLPPPLQHIGLSHNNITAVSSLIQPGYWKSLLSLDLSFNDLENLFYTCDLLKELPKLRNLHLKGNPFYLFIGYRGYLVDSLQSLAFLDEVNVSAHERHLFKGLHRLKESLTSEFCAVNVKLCDLKGLIKHEEVDQADDLHQTVVRHHVEFSFLKETCVFNNDDRVLSNDLKLSVEENNGTSDLENNYRILKSNDFNFADEEMELLCNKYIVCKDPKQLISFLSKIMEVRIVRNIITMSDEVQGEHEQSNHLSVLETDPSDKMGKRSKVKRDSIQSVSRPKLSKPRKVKHVGDLYEVSRTSETCAKVDVDCRAILEGSLEIKKECTFTLLDVFETEPEVNVVNNTPPERGKKKNTRISTKQQQDSSTKGTTGGGKASGKGEVKIEETAVEIEVDSPHMEPPTLNFLLKVIHWDSAIEGSDWLERNNTNFCY